MSGAPTGGVELLERALAYTRGALVHVTPPLLHRRTPCAAWSLDELLVHMDDALDAFTEGFAGVVDVDPAASLEVRVGTLQAKACGLLGLWSGPGAPPTVRVGGVAVDTAVLVRAAALEITVHGWDVAQATGRLTPLPDDLARQLAPVAAALVCDDDRGRRFAEPIGVGDHADTGPGTRLLAFLGRAPGTDLTGPPRDVSGIHRTQHRSAS